MTLATVIQVDTIFTGGSQNLPPPAPKAQPWKKWSGIDPTTSDSGSLLVSFENHDHGTNGLGGY